MGLFDRQPKHRHQWGEATLTFTPPLDVVARRDFLKTWDPDYDPDVMFERAMHGFTTITQRCATCGKVDTTKVIGRAEQ
jgi:hypothetical protein